MLEGFSRWMVNAVVKSTHDFFFFLNLRKFSKTWYKIVKLCFNFWNQHGKCIKMNTNMPLFGSVVLEIACGIFISEMSFFYWIDVILLSVKSGFSSIIMAFVFKKFAITTSCQYTFTPGLSLSFPIIGSDIQANKTAIIARFPSETC